MRRGIVVLFFLLLLSACAGCGGSHPLYPTAVPVTPFVSVPAPTAKP